MSELQSIKKVIGKVIQEVEPVSMLQELRLLLDGNLCLSSGDSWLLKNSKGKSVIGSSDIERILEEDEDAFDREDEKVLKKTKVLEGTSISTVDFENDCLYVVFDNKYTLVSFCSTSEGFIAPIYEY